jgi:hypothetical protein
LKGRAVDQMTSGQRADVALAKAKTRVAIQVIEVSLGGSAQTVQRAAREALELVRDAESLLPDVGPVVKTGGGDEA